MRRLACLGVLLLAACSGADDRDILVRLEAVPGLHVTEKWPAGGDPNARYFALALDEPLDHRRPAGPGFELSAELIHVDDTAPTVLDTSGYGASFVTGRGELANALGANYLTVSYRYFDQDVADPDWSLLTVEQATADFHDVVLKLRPVEGTAWIHAGASKGGVAALAARYYDPYDVDGVVAYVAPISTGQPDERHAHVLDRIGDDACRAALRRAARAIAERRPELEALVGSPADYSILGVDYATQLAIDELEWSFWQYRGELACDAIPSPDAPDATLARFLADTSPVSGYQDERMRDVIQPYVWQTMSQLGYPRVDLSNLADLTTIDYQDLTPQLPPGVAAPTFDPTLSHELVDWARSDATRVLLVYGEWDPWTAGAIDVDPANDSHRFVVAHASHLSATLEALDPAERAEASDALARWTGVTPRF